MLLGATKTEKLRCNVVCLVHSSLLIDVNVHALSCMYVLGTLDMDTAELFNPINNMITLATWNFYQHNLFSCCMNYVLLVCLSILDVEEVCLHVGFTVSFGFFSQ